MYSFCKGAQISAQCRRFGGGVFERADVFVVVLSFCVCVVRGLSVQGLEASLSFI